MEGKETGHNPAEMKLETNSVNVSMRKDKSFFIFVGKKILEKHGDLVLNALGNATTTAVITAESLVRNGYAEYVNLETKTISVEQNQGRDDRKPSNVNRAKLIITLKKSKDFDKNLKKFNEIREENLAAYREEQEAHEGTKK